MTQPLRRPGATDIAALRRLIGLRERQPTSASLSATASATAAAHPSAARVARAVMPLDRALPGQTLTPGLQLIEDFLPQPLPQGPLPLAFARRPDESVEPEQLLFFDTETTGLAGGTGTRAFMIGAADWHQHPQHGPGLRVRQLLISTLGAETAMLDAFADWLQPETVLCSFNGRSYDAPLLKTRFRLARRPDPISALDHVDLLHPARRRYRGRWENCRLATLERQLLQIHRDDDLPGSQAPAAWLDYLRGGSARNLRRVGEHNHQDVVTLAKLFGHLLEEDSSESDQVSAG